MVTPLRVLVVPATVVMTPSAVVSSVPPLIVAPDSATVEGPTPANAPSVASITPPVAVTTVFDSVNVV